MKRIVKCFAILLISCFFCAGTAYAGEYEVSSKNATDLSNETKSISETSLVQMNVITNNVNNSEGAFRVSAQAVQNGEYIKTVHFAIWSEVNGQDDIRWYDADWNGSGEYLKDISIASHKYSLGKYQIHVYVTDILGEFYLAGKTTQNFEIQNGNFVISKGVNEYSYTVSLDSVEVPGGIAEVLFPIWSAKNGQDDICWYRAKDVGGGVYQTNISLKNHKGLGQLSLHAYVRTRGGKIVCVGKEVVRTDSPTLGKMDVQNYEKEKGTFQIVLSDIDNSGLVQEIQVPVWSAAGGQDDIIWYTAKMNEEGQYIVNVNIKDHKYTMGEYIAHAYIKDITGDFCYAGALSHNVSIETGRWSVAQEIIDKTQYTVELSDVIVPGGAVDVQVAIWSEKNGQDDLRWYNTKEYDGTYKLNVSLKSHRGLGVYHMHAYAKMPNGFLRFIGEESFETKTPKIGKVTVSNVEKTSGKFQINISGIENSELIRKISVPVWSEKNQGDIKWYEAVKNIDGDYVVNVELGNHKYNTGVYNIHVYLTDVVGDMRFVGNTTCDMKAEYIDFLVKDTDGLEKTYNITLNGLKVPAGEKSVQFAVWGDAKGQNDIRWYSAKKISDGTYGATVSVNDHRELGTYQVHAYCTTKANISSFVGMTSFAVEKKPQMTVATVSEIDGSKGSFKVTVSGLMAPSGIEKVKIPVWCAGDQSDIKWYDAVKVSEGMYTVNVKVANHSHHFGEYKIHVYATMGNGIMLMTGSTTAHIEAKNYVYSMSIDSMRTEVGIMGATGTRVQFPTWSEAYGQDDVVWYEGNNCGNGKWNTVVNSLNHKSAGKYITHVYVNDGAGSKYVGEVSYSLNRLPADQSAMMARANMYSSPTPYLILVNRSTHKVGVFHGWQGNWNMIHYWDCADGKASTPTVEGIFRVGSRGYYFNSGSYRCYWWTQFYGDYLFHSVLYDWNGVLQDGRVGIALSHGCVRLPIDRAKWIYDVIPSGTTVVVYH